MSDIADRYRRLSDAFTEKVRSVPADRWDDPSPCQGWTASDVVRHVTDTQGMFLGFIGREIPTAPSAGDDRLTRWTRARDAVRAALDEEGAATQTFQGFFGATSFEDAVDRFLSFDLVVHGWDLGRAAGLDTRIDPAEVDRLTRDVASFGDAARAPGVFGPQLDAAPEADAQTRLLALVGRRA